MRRETWLSRLLGSAGKPPVSPFTWSRNSPSQDHMLTIDATNMSG